MSINRHIHKSILLHIFDTIQALLRVLLALKVLTVIQASPSFILDAALQANSIEERPKHKTIFLINCELLLF